MLQLKKFPDIPVSTRVEAPETRPHPEEPRFRLLAREEGSFPCVVGKNSQRSRPISRGGALHRKGERNSRVVARFQEFLRCLSPFQRNLFSLNCLQFDAEDRLTPRWQVGQPCGKASWESHEGKPRGKPQIPLSTGREARHCCYSSGGKRTYMPPLEMTTGSPGETPEVPQDPCQHWRGILRFRN